MPFGTVSGVSRWMGVLDGVVITEGAILGVNLGHPALLHSCVEVREPIELSFEVVSGVGPGIHVLHGVLVTQREGANLGLFVSQTAT